MPGGPAAAAWQHLLTSAAAVVVSRTSVGDQVATEVRLADGSTAALLTGLSSWARPGGTGPLQMWVTGEVVLDDGPLSPAAARFLDDLRLALTAPGPGAVPGYTRGPLSQWLSRRATLDPATHRVDPDGVARPHDGGDDVRVWDASQGWVSADVAGDLAEVVAQALVPHHAMSGPYDGAVVADVLEAAGRLPAAIRAGRTAELQAASSTAQAAAREGLGDAVEALAGASVPWALAEVLRMPATPLFTVGGRVLVQLADGGLAVVVEATSESAALPGSRPGLVQAGTTADLGRFRGELWRAPGGRPFADQLTQALVSGRVRQFRVQQVVSSAGFTGTRVTEFAVRRGIPGGVGVERVSVEPQRHVRPGPGVEMDLARAAAADVVPAEPARLVERGFRLLELVNPMERTFDPQDRAAVPYRNNCGDVSRAVADLFQGATVRAALGDTAERLSPGWDTPAGRRPEELQEMYSWTGAEPEYYLALRAGANPARFTDQAWRAVAQAMRGAPVGAVAVVLVNWSTTSGAIAGGHWFNAVQGVDGLHWVDGQSGRTARWDDGLPYGAGIGLVGAVVRSSRGEPWQDLRVLQGGPSWARPVGGSAGSGPSEAVALPAAAVAPGDEGQLRRPVDWALAVSLANATGGELPDDEPRLVGVLPDRARVEVRSPAGDVVALDVRWVDGYPPTLVLTQLPGQAFWWDVPAAVQQAVRQAVQVLTPDPGLLADAVVLGRRPGAGAELELVRFPVEFGAGGLALCGAPSALSRPEAAQASIALGLDG